MPAEMVDTSSALTVSNSGSGDASVSFSTHQAAGTSTAMAPPLPVATKKKRNLPGMPDPDAEVISLSPRALMATNRFVCEICNKGFQRDQNLQLHRRGHNLPWKLRQRTTNEVKKRVYICPEPSCIHHSPSRALGDLTGIKKHFSRKHGEKKWKCDKCSKWYAVQSDWKAHYKTCGTREYRCDCGTLFSRRDGFITHRAFCDALAEEKVKVVVQTSAAEANSGTSDDFPTVMVPSSSPSQQRTLFPAATSPHSTPVVHQQNWQQLKELENTIDAEQIRTQIPLPATVQHPPLLVADNSSSTATTSSSSAGSSTCLLASLFSSAAPLSTTIFNDLIASVSNPDRRGFTPSSPLEPTYLSLSATKSTNLFAGDGSEHHQQSCEPLTPSSPHMSATALLQKSAQLSATATNSSLLSGFTLSTATSLPLMNNQQKPSNNIHENYQWEYQNRKIDLIEQKRLSSGLDLGLQFDDGGEGSTVVVGGLPEFSSLCGVKPATFDFLGLEMGPVCSNSELSAIMTSIVSDGLEMGSSFGSRSTIGQDRNGMGKKPNGP